MLAVDSVDVRVVVKAAAVALAAGVVILAASI